MNTEFINDWVTELRSGNRQQITGELHVIENGKEGFCCLGVAQDMLTKRGVAIANRWSDEGDGFCKVAYVDDTPNRAGEDGWGETGVLTDKVARYIGFDDSHPEIVIPDGDDGSRSQSYALAELNDEGFTFDQIADLIEWYFGGEK